MSHLAHLSESLCLLGLGPSKHGCRNPPPKTWLRKPRQGSPESRLHLAPDSPRESKTETLPVIGMREPQGKTPLGTWGPPTAATASTPRRACASSRLRCACAMGVLPRGRGPLSPKCRELTSYAASPAECAASAALAPPPAAPPARPNARRLLPRARSGERGVVMGSGMSQVTSGPGRPPSVCGFRRQAQPAQPAL